MPATDPVVVGAASAVLSAVMTFIVSRKDANTRASEHSVQALSSTIDRLEKHIAHLDNRLMELEQQLDIMSSENIKLMTEVHSLRRALATEQNGV